nr:MAG TPA: hypothetical protein [Caudoviricetes sp.]
MPLCFCQVGGSVFVCVVGHFWFGLSGFALCIFIQVCLWLCR